jgi:hypothetical protein
MVAKPRKQNVLTKGPGKGQGPPRPLVTMRLPEDVIQYLRALEEESDLSRGETVTKVVRFFRDFRHRLDTEWWEVERRAKVNGTSSGDVAGGLIFDLLVADKKKK